MLLDEKTPLPIKEVNFNKGVDVDVYDIAVIVVEPHSLEIKALELADASVLDEVLVIGYPPIAGFDTIQIAETASIGSYLKAVQ